MFVIFRYSVESRAEHFHNYQRIAPFKEENLTYEKKNKIRNLNAVHKKQLGE